MRTLPSTGRPSTRGSVVLTVRFDVTGLTADQRSRFLGALIAQAEGLDDDPDGYPELPYLDFVITPAR